MVDVRRRSLLATGLLTVCVLASKATDALREEIARSEAKCSDSANGCDDSDIVHYTELMLQLGDAEEAPKDAIAAYEHATQTSFEHFGVASELHLRCVDVLISKLLALGLHEAAVPLCNGRVKALLEAEEHEALDSDARKRLRASRARALTKLGEVSFHADKPTEALEALEAAVALLDAEGGLLNSTESSRARTQLSRALVESSGGDAAVYDRALELAQRAVADASDAVGPENGYVPPLELPVALNAEAGVLEKMGKIDEALEAMQRAYMLVQQVPAADPKLAQSALANLEAMMKRDSKQGGGASERLVTKLEKQAGLEPGAEIPDHMMKGEL